jgi:hypothetical protein
VNQLIGDTVHIGSSGNVNIDASGTVAKSRVIQFVE